MRVLPSLLLLLLLLAAPARAESGTMASAVGDFDGDGQVDVAVMRSDRMDLLAGDGRGGFAAPRAFAEGTRFGVIGQTAVADLDADGRQDLIVMGLQGATAFRGGSLEVLWTVPDANLLDAVPWPDERSLAMLSGRSLSVYPLREDGALGTPAVHTLPAEGWTLCPIPDGLAAGTVGSADAMLIREGGQVEQVPMGEEVGGLAAGDFNGDGRLDLVSLLHPRIRVRNGAGGAVAELPGDTVHSGGEVADFTGDGLPDVATLLPPGAVLLAGRADAVVAEPQVVGACQGATHLAVGDLDADGRPDLVLTFLVRDRVALLYNEGGGEFRTVVLPVGP